MGCHAQIFTQIYALATLPQGQSSHWSLVSWIEKKKNAFWQKDHSVFGGKLLQIDTIIYNGDVYCKRQEGKWLQLNTQTQVKKGISF